ncbi:hypothetical protein J3F83DRAFT_730246 [Trichoderma novae-zelandiae]
MNPSRHLTSGVPFKSLDRTTYVNGTSDDSSGGYTSTSFHLSQSRVSCVISEHNLKHSLCLGNLERVAQMCLRDTVGVHEMFGIFQNFPPALLSKPVYKATVSQVGGILQGRDGLQMSCNGGVRYAPHKLEIMHAGMARLLGVCPSRGPGCSHAGTSYCFRVPSTIRRELRCLGVGTPQPLKLSARPRTCPANKTHATPPCAASAQPHPEAERQSDSAQAAVAGCYWPQPQRAK